MREYIEKHTDKYCNFKLKKKETIIKLRKQDHELM